MCVCVGRGGARLEVLRAGRKEEQVGGKNSQAILLITGRLIAVVQASGFAVNSTLPVNDCVRYSV